MKAARRRTRPHRTYSLAYLLSRQPKTLQKDSNYPFMIAHLRTSPRLKRLRIGRRCYSLLDRAVIAPENLDNFYRTYRLPVDPFFPLFFSVKRSYLNHRRHLKEQRERSILETMRSLPPDVRSVVVYLGKLEQHYNAADRYPIWQAHLFPKTKKRAHELTRLDTGEWVELFAAHLSRLATRYSAFSHLAGAVQPNASSASRSTDPRASAAVGADRLLASFTLGLVLDSIPPRWPSSAAVNRAYRRLSLLHHPDRGGDPARFLAIKDARDTLLGKD